MVNLHTLSQSLAESLELAQAPVAVAFSDQMPEGVSPFSGRVAAGCQFWRESAFQTFSTVQDDHASCAIGQYTHNLGFSPASEKDLGDALKVFADLGYVRPEDLPQIPVLQAKPKHVVYGRLATFPVAPEAVLLFVRADQQLILSEAAQQVESGAVPALGRPACAIVPQAVNSGRAALSLGCCGARAYVDTLTPDVALFALPGAKLEEYVSRIVALSQANAVLTQFHGLRRRQFESGGQPSVAESLAALQSA
jgi:uncharacterized protein (DUF169 family)